MAQITFNRLSKSGSSALVQVKSNPLEMGNGTFAYVSADGISHYFKKPADEVTKGAKCNIPDGFSLVQMFDMETGEARSYENGEPLLQLTYQSTPIAVKETVEVKNEVNAEAKPTA